jgi:mono/diheme cytochrome c family protein
MKRFNSLKSRLRAGLSLVPVAAAVYALSAACLTAADPKPETDAKEKKIEKKAVSGADLYAMHCNRCHPERYATERTAAQWKTIMLHMRIRANLPAVQAKAILKYLQEDSGK